MKNYYLAICFDPSAGIAAQYVFKADRPKKALHQAIARHWQLNGYEPADARREASTALDNNYTKAVSDTGSIWTAADGVNYWVMVKQC